MKDTIEVQKAADRKDPLPFFISIGVA